MLDVKVLVWATAHLQGARRAETARRLLVFCGIAYAVTYVVTNDLIAATSYEGYSRMDQAVSELSALSAPSRTFLMAMLPVYTMLMLAFGVGVWWSAAGGRALRLTASALVAFGVTGVLWLPFPMSAREDIVQSSTMSANDVGHLVLSGITGVLIIAMCAAGAAHFGRWFRVYTIASVSVVLLFSGVLTGIQSSQLPSGEPTPLLGFFERVGIGAWLLWLAVLATTLLRTRVDAGVRDLPPGVTPRHQDASPIPR